MTSIGRVNPKALVVTFLASMVIFSAGAFAQTANKQTAILVEADGNPTCAGLDCPPWHVAPDFDVCLKADQKFYFGFYSAYKGPWAKKVDLHKFEGQPVEIQPSEKYIRIVSPRFNVKLKRIYGAGNLFRTQTCKNAHAS
jgi:hypothetical protein